MSDVLTRICAEKRRHVAAAKAARGEEELLRVARGAAPVRGFRDALEAAGAASGSALIAEIKKASPSKGLIRADFDPPALAREYHAGGAACLSVLTDAPFFQGADGDLGAARAAAALPVLRKDFVVDPYQAVEARAIGADCILLIMAAVEDADAAEIADAARELGMDVLVEVHDEAEMERAGGLESRLVGINNRDLATFAVDLATTERLAPRAPAGALVVSESGLSGPEDLARMRRAGVSCFLIGESLLRERDVAAATRALLDPVEPRARTAVGA